MRAHEPHCAEPSPRDASPQLPSNDWSVGAEAAEFGVEFGVAESSASVGASTPLLLPSLTPSEAASSQRLNRRKSAAVMQADF